MTFPDIKAPVLALDPGTTQTAYIVFDGCVIYGMGHVENNELLALLKSGDLLPYETVAIEMIACYGMPVGKETFDTCLWIGRFMERAKKPVSLVYRKDIKLHLCGTTKAKDGNVSQALKDKHGEVGTKKNPGPLYGVSKHIWSALAVADYHLSHQSHA